MPPGGAAQRGSPRRAPEGRQSPPRRERLVQPAQARGSRWEHASPVRPRRDGRAPASSDNRDEVSRQQAHREPMVQLFPRHPLIELGGKGSRASVSPATSPVQRGTRRALRNADAATASAGPARGALSSYCAAPVSRSRAQPPPRAAPGDAFGARRARRAGRGRVVHTAGACPRYSTGRRSGLIAIVRSPARRSRRARPPIRRSRARGPLPGRTSSTTLSSAPMQGRRPRCRAAPPRLLQTPCCPYPRRSGILPR